MAPRNQSIFDDVPDARRRIMRRIGNRDTGPERRVRSMLHHAGYRFRTNIQALPGRPDIAFKARMKAIFIHGCFWHQHAACRDSTPPKTRTEYWQQKFASTIARDRRNLVALQDLGWDVFVVWECEMSKRPHDIESKLQEFLGPTLWPRNSQRY